MQQATPGRYRFHDLLRAYARDRADRDESSADRLAAVRRLLGWYLSAADAAQRTLSPSTEPVPLAGVDGPGPPVFATPTDALDWCRSEHDNLLAASRVAVDRGLHELAWRIPVALKVYLEYTRPWNDWLALGELAVTSARRAEDQSGEVRALNVLGNAYWELRRFGESRQSQELALAINREIGQRHAEGTCLNNIGACYQAVGDFARAISYYGRALTIALEFDDPAALMSRGVALMSLGESHHGLGRFSEAIGYYTRSLEILRKNGNRYHESFAVTYLGHTCSALGHWDAARSWYEQALAIHDTMENRYGEAETLIGLAAVLDHEDRAAEANRNRNQAAAILDELNAPRNDKLRSRIAGARIDPAVLGR